MVPLTNALCLTVSFASFMAFLRCERKDWEGKSMLFYFIAPICLALGLIL